MAKDYVVLKRARPNGWNLRLLQFTNSGWIVEEAEEENEVSETDFETLEAAVGYFEERQRVLSETPNWELQEKYDEEHGTINGYAPWQYNRREY